MIAGNEASQKVGFVEFNLNVALMIVPGEGEGMKPSMFAGRRGERSSVAPGVDAYST